MLYKSAKRQRGSNAAAVEMANLEEALRWNKDTVKNFKYEMTLQGRSVPTLAHSGRLNIAGLCPAPFRTSPSN